MDVSEGVRLEWACNVQNILQAAVGDLLDGDPDAGNSIVHRLKRDLLPAGNDAEYVLLRAALVPFLDRSAHSLHDRFHKRSAPALCGAEPRLEPQQPWITRDRRLDDLLDGWSRGFIEWFDQHHEIPPLLRALRFLRRHPGEPLSVDQLARAIGSSSGTLNQQFKRIIGITPAECLRRRRVADGLRRLRGSTGPIDEAARLAGYNSENKFYRWVRHYTGLTPSQIRSMPDPQFERLLEERVGISQPRRRFSFVNN